MQMRFLTVRKARITLIVLIAILITSIVTVTYIENSFECKLLFHGLDSSNIVAFSTLSVTLFVALFIATLFKKTVSKIGSIICKR